MSRLTETKRAFDKVTALLDQEIRKKTSNSKDLEKYRAIVEIAFYVLAFGQFEYLVKREANGIIDENAALKTHDGRAWKIVQQKGDVSLRKLLDLIYHTDQKVLKSLNDSYTIRNDSVHGNQMLPKCPVPCDHIPVRSWPLFRARQLMRDVIESLQGAKKS